jgi:hypothetical protein
MEYQKITEHERFLIYNYLRLGRSLRRIADRLLRSLSTNQLKSNIIHGLDGIEIDKLMTMLACED